MPNDDRQVIKELRDNLGLKQGQVALRIGRSTGTVSLYERGLRESLPILERLAAALRVEIGDLVGDTLYETERLDVLQLAYVARRLPPKMVKQMLQQADEALARIERASGEG